jgi:hypothetical protein
MDLPESVIGLIRKSFGRHNAVLFILVIPAVIYLPGIIGWIPFPSGENTYTDLLIAHYPYSLFLKKSLLQHGVVPLWSNLIYSGAPFIANPLTNFWYIPGWISIIFPLPAGINITLGLHAIFGSLGFYLFMKEEGVGWEAALISGVAFGMMPKVHVHYGAGHVSLIYAITWTPWLFLVGRRDQVGWKTGLIAAFLFLADPRWAVLAGAIWVSYIFAHRHKYERSLPVFLLRGGIVALLVSSPLIVPLIEYAKLSTRAMLTTTERLVYSLPPERLAGLLFPVSGGNLEWFLYIGGLPLVLFVVQLCVPKLRKENLFWEIWVAISILYAFGSYLPGVNLIADIPPFTWLRVPARALFLTGLSLIVISAKTLDSIKKGQVTTKKIKLVSVGFLAATMLFILGLIILLDELSMKALWGLIVLGLSSLICFGISVRKDNKIWLVMAVTLVVVDCCTIGVINNTYKRVEEIFYVPDLVLSHIGADEDIFRLYSPSYSVPQHIAALNGLELADGVDPFQISYYRDFMDNATGIETHGYSVTIPPFKSGRPQIDNKGFQPDASLLGILNVKYLISSYEVFGEGLDLIGEFPEGFLYRNEFCLPRAWVLPQGTRIDDPIDYRDISIVQDVEKKPNRASIRANGPGLLVLSEINYPGWRVKVNGVHVKASDAYGILQSVIIPPGSHEVVFYYFPASVIIGLIFGLFGLGYCLYRFITEDDRRLYK